MPLLLFYYQWFSILQIAAGLYATVYIYVYVYIEYFTLNGHISDRIRAICSSSDGWTCDCGLKLPLSPLSPLNKDENSLKIHQKKKTDGITDAEMCHINDHLERLELT